MSGQGLYEYRKKFLKETSACRDAKKDRNKGAIEHNTFLPSYFILMDGKLGIILGWPTWRFSPEFAGLYLVRRSSGNNKKSCEGFFFQCAIIPLPVIIPGMLTLLGCGFSVHLDNNGNIWRNYNCVDTKFSKWIIGDVLKWKKPWK